MAKYNAYFRQGGETVRKSNLVSKVSLEKAIEACCNKAGERREMCENALYERGYYTIGYGPDQVLIEEIVESN